MTDRIIDSFGFLRYYIGWFAFVVGNVMFLATLVGLASFGSGWKVFLASLAGWLVLACEGFDMIAEESDG